jgi:hypothetical protein
VNQLVIEMEESYGAGLLDIVYTEAIDEAEACILRQMEDGCRSLFSMQHNSTRFSVVYDLKSLLVIKKQIQTLNLDLLAEDLKRPTFERPATHEDDAAFLRMSHFDHLLCTMGSFTDKCNLQAPYCIKEEDFVQTNGDRFKEKMKNISPPQIEYLFTYEPATFMLKGDFPRCLKRIDPDSAVLLETPTNMIPGPYYTSDVSQIKRTKMMLFAGACKKLQSNMGQFMCLERECYRAQQVGLQLKHYYRIFTSFKISVEESFQRLCDEVLKLRHMYKNITALVNSLSMNKCEILKKKNRGIEESAVIKNVLKNVNAMILKGVWLLEETHGSIMELNNIYRREQSLIREALVKFDRQLIVLNIGYDSFLVKRMNVLQSLLNLVKRQVSEVAYIRRDYDIFFAELFLDEYSSAGNDCWGTVDCCVCSMKSLNNNGLDAHVTVCGKYICGQCFWKRLHEQLLVCCCADEECKKCPTFQNEPVGLPVFYPHSLINPLIPTVQPEKMVVILTPIGLEEAKEATEQLRKLFINTPSPPVSR